MVVGSGSEGTSKYVGEGVVYGLHFLIFHLDAFTVAEASTGRSWVTEGEGMAPQVSPLVQAFLSTTRRRVSPSILWECWPPRQNIVPRQPMDEVRAHITQCLDKVAM